MVALLELKEKLVRFYGKYEAYITPLLRFLLGLVAFLLINANIGYMKTISRTPIAIKEYDGKRIIRRYVLHSNNL